MSGVVNQFDAKSIRYSVSEKQVYVIDQYDSRLTFRFDIVCKRQSLTLFFNTATNQCFICHNYTNYTVNMSNYVCYVLRYSLEEDLPVFSVRIFDNLVEIVGDIADQFREQYASLVLDGIINQD